MVFFPKKIHFNNLNSMVLLKIFLENFVLTLLIPLSKIRKTNENLQKVNIISKVETVAIEIGK